MPRSQGPTAAPESERGMRLEELIELLENIHNEYPHLRDYSVTVVLDGNGFSIERVEPDSDGAMIILEF